MNKLVQKGGMHRFRVNEQFITSNGKGGRVISLLEKYADDNYSYVVIIDKPELVPGQIKLYENDMIKINSNIDELISKINITKINDTIIHFNEYYIRISLNLMNNDFNELRSNAEVSGKYLTIEYINYSFPIKKLKLEWFEKLKISLDEDTHVVTINGDGFTFNIVDTTNNFNIDDKRIIGKIINKLLDFDKNDSRFLKSDMMVPGQQLINIIANVQTVPQLADITTYL